MRKAANPSSLDERAASDQEQPQTKSSLRTKMTRASLILITVLFVALYICVRPFII